MKTFKKHLLVIVLIINAILINAQSTIQINSETGIISINGQENKSKGDDFEIYNAYSLSNLLFNYQNELINFDNSVKLIKALKWYNSNDILIPDIFKRKIIDPNKLKLEEIDTSKLNSLSDTSICASLVEYKKILHNLDQEISSKSNNSLENYFNTKKEEIKSILEKNNTDFDLISNQIIESYSKEGMVLPATEPPLVNDTISKEETIPTSTIFFSTLNEINEKYKKRDIISVYKIDSILNSSYNKDTILGKLKSETDKLLIKKDSIKNAAYLLILELPIEDIKKIYKDSLNNLSEGIINSFKDLNINSDNVSLSSELVIKLSEQSSSSPFSFKMPSQAEMIDAMAIYLAKRVKQELSLWFFDEIRKNAKNYNLIEKAFPESIKLLSQLEVYEAPNLGSAWRYALAKDFVMMPEKLLDPTVIKNKEHRETLAYLKVGIDIYKLINQNYSYRDVITQLYLENDKIICNSNVCLNDIVTLLYAVNNELYNIETVNGTPQLTHLDYNFLRTLNSNQLITMFKLINSKYEGILNKFFPYNIEKGENLDNTIRWLGGIGMSLEQFSTVVKDFQKLAQDKRNGNAKTMDFVYEAPSVFKLTIGLLESVIPNKDTDNKVDFEKAKKGIVYLEKLLEAYELYSNKNYAGGTIKVVEIVGELLENNEREVYSLEKLTKQLTDIEFLNFVKKEELLRLAHSKDLINNVIKKENLQVNLNVDSLIKMKKIHLKNFSNELLKELENNIKDTSIASNLLKVLTRDSLFGKIDMKVLESSLKEDLDKKIKEMNNSAKIGKINNIININLWDLNSKKKIDSLKNLKIKLDTDFNAFLISNKDIIKEYVENSVALSHITKLGSFLNDVALTNDSKDLAKVVETYAMPPGTYKKKRNSWFSLDLNAYVGPYVSAEFVKVPDSLGSSLKVGSYGFTAPIGLTLSFTKRKCNVGSPSSYDLEKYLYKDKSDTWKERSDATFYFTTSFVDIGAMVAFRFANSTDSDVEIQKFKWAQFFSPGFSFGVGIPNTPLVASIGYQYAPQIRRISLVKEQFNAHRLALGILVDIPLFNMYTKRNSKFE